MNLDDFLAKLKEIKDTYHWEVFCPSIRAIPHGKNIIGASWRGDIMCPITGVSKGCFDLDISMTKAMESGNFIGLDDVLTAKIMFGADYDTIEGMKDSYLTESEKEEVLQIRHKMLEILNLKEPAPHDN